MDERLRPFERLQRPREFRRVFQRGRAFRTAPMRIHFVPATGTYSRLGLVVRRSVGKAVTRNLVKRRLRELFRRSKYALGAAYDVVLVPQGTAREFEDYSRSFQEFVEHVSTRPWTRPRRGPRRESRPNGGQPRGRQPGGGQPEGERRRPAPRPGAEQRISGT